NSCYANPATQTPPQHLDQSGIKDFTPVVTPRVAVAKSFDRAISIYGQISWGYTPPASGSVVIPQIGMVNSSLKPERATLYEIGSKGDLIAGRFLYEVALFDMQVKNKFTSQSALDAAGNPYAYTTNAGDQTNQGIEASAKYAIVRNSESALSLLQPFV